MNPYELLAQRHREYAKAQDRHVRALAKQAAAQERVQALGRELADAEDADRRTLGDALVGGKKPPALKTGQARASLQQAKAEAEALAYACERAGQELDGMPAARRGDWLPQAKRDFEAARADYERRLALLIETHEGLAQEATLVDFLAAGSSISMAPILHVRVGGVEGLVHDVPVTDVLAALREQMFDLEVDVLLGAKA
jgi:hypothetical protein